MTHASSVATATPRARRHVGVVLLAAITALLGGAALISGFAPAVRASDAASAAGSTELAPAAREVRVTVVAAVSAAGVSAARASQRSLSGDEPTPWSALPVASVVLLGAALITSAARHAEVGPASRRVGPPRGRSPPRTTFVAA